MSNRSTIDRSVPPTVHDVPLMPIPEVETTVLSNGIKLVTLNSNDIDDVTRVTLSWHGGSYDAINAPAAEIASRLSRTGSTLLSPEQTADLFDFNGGWLSTELTGHNNTLTLFSLNRTLDTLTGAVVDMINQPLHDLNELAVIREKLAASRATALEKVTTLAEESDNELTFGIDHPIARRYSPEDIRAVDSEMVKSASVRLREKQAPVAFAVGHLTQQVLDTITAKLQHIDCSPIGTGNVSVTPASTSNTTRVNRNVPGALQSAVRISIPTVNRSHPDYEAVRLMTTALGGYFGSRLMTNIREEKGLTYGIGAAVYGYREGAFITINCQCDNRYVERVIDEIKHEIDLLATVPMDADELTAVKQTATGSLLSMLDTPFSIMDYYVTQRHVLTPPDYFTRQQKAISTLTPESIKETAERYLANRTCLISTAGAC